MNSDSAVEKGGVRPSGRKCIHRNCALLPFCENMGRYGVNMTNNQNNRSHTLSHNDQDIDEVDNAMSKMARQLSPPPRRKINKIQRTNSYSQDEDHSDISTMLSKSLPATLPSHLYYRNDSDSQEPYYSESSIAYSRLEDNSHLSESKNTSNQNTIPEISYRQNTEQAQSTNKLYYISFVSVLVSLIAILYYYMNPVSITLEKSTQTESHNVVLFERSMKNLQEKYNIDNDNILKLQSGISFIFSRMDTGGSFIFLYNSNANNFDAMRFRNFTNEVAYTTARYLRKNIKSIEKTTVESSHLDMQEHSELIQRYRDDLDKTGVLLVWELDDVPSDLAMAFHYYCDEYDPLVKRSAIFFTLNLANCSQSSEPKSTHEFVEKCLARKWKTVPPENIRPLLTRVVDTVIDVTSVF